MMPGLPASPRDETGDAGELAKVVGMDAAEKEGSRDSPGSNGHEAPSRPGSSAALLRSTQEYETASRIGKRFSSAVLWGFARPSKPCDGGSPPGG